MFGKDEGMGLMEEYEVGQKATINAISGTIIEVRETDMERLVKMETDLGKVVIFRFVKREFRPGLNELRLG
jgi:hypothetical protein